MNKAGIVPEKYQKVVSTIFYLVAGVVGLVFVIANTAGILAAAGMTRFPEGFTPNQCLFLLGLSVAFMSTLFWFGMVLGVFESDERFDKLVSRGFIAGVFAAVLSAVNVALSKQ